MADPNAPSSLLPTFPAPPPFYKSFTPENIALLARFENYTPPTASLENDSLPSESIPFRLNQESLLELPAEIRERLQYLVPPAPPADESGNGRGEYVAFGEVKSLSAPSPSLPPETPLLITPPPTPAALLLLTRSILLSYHELIAILAADPSPTTFGPKWEDLRDLFRNAHQMVNAYRPFQAREALISMLEGQIERAKGEIKGMETLGERVRAVIEGLGEGVDDGAEGGVGEGGREMREDESRKGVVEWERRAWEVLDEGEGVVG